MKKSTRVISILLALVMIMSLATQNAFAVTPSPTVGWKLDRGITRISWWMSYENNGGWYEYQIINAVNNWESPGWTNPMNFVAASSNSGTMIDIYTEDSAFFATLGNSTANAGTQYFAQNGVNPLIIGSVAYYRFTRIYINDTVLHNAGATNMKASIAHEIGHSLGLDENNSNKYSIMCQAGSGRKVSTVQECDNTAVVNLYS